MLPYKPHNSVKAVMIDFVAKLMTLTSEFIEASADKTARDIRDELVADIFPDLSKEERDQFSDHTELDDMLRMLEANFGDMIDSDEALVRVAKEAITHLRHTEDMERQMLAMPKSEP